MSDGKDKANCRACGGVRWHAVLHKEQRPWSDEDLPISGGDTYEILECLGCSSIGFRHTSWFSEDYDAQGTPVPKIDYYPPLSDRPVPSWLESAYFWLPAEEEWIGPLLRDIYASVGLKSYSLAAMGARAIVDALITNASGGGRSFPDKLKKLVGSGVLSQSRSDVIAAAFDAGSAVAHRGHQVDSLDLHRLLSIMEALVYDFRVKPEIDRDQAKAAANLKSKIPPRKKE